MPDLQKKVAIHDELVGRVLLGKFDVQQILSSGSSGTVYKAIQVNLGRVVALKVLNNDLCHDEQGIRRFRREAKAARNFASHSFLSTVFECGFLEDNRPFIAMQYVDGVSLAARLEQSGAFKVESALPLFIQIADGLAFAHSNEVLHRDLSPDNIMLCRTPERGSHAIVIDFGLARPTGNWAANTEQMTRFGSALGHPPCMSPEHCSGKNLDGRSDVYSFGCTLFETLTGKPPFAGRNTLEIMNKHLHEQPPIAVVQAKREEVANAVVALIASCLEKDSAKRFGSMTELKAALEGVLDGQVIAPKIQDPSHYVPRDESEDEAQLPVITVVVAPATAPTPAPVEPKPKFSPDPILTRTDAFQLVAGCGKLIFDTTVHRILLILLSVIVVAYSIATMGPQIPLLLKSDYKPTKAGKKHAPQIPAVNDR